MTEFNLPVVDNTVAQLFQASQYSLDPSTADFMLRRVVPITIYIDGDYEGLTEVAENLENEIVRILAEAGYTQVGAWGPFSGSHLTTIFGKGENWESGPQVLQHLRDLGDQLRQLKVPPEAVAGVRVVLVVGTLVIHLASLGAAAATVLSFTLPVGVIAYLALAEETVDVIEATRHVLKLKPFFLARGGKFEF
jgi:hypothetical protein